jgi:hypothetical protein
MIHLAFALLASSAVPPCNAPEVEQALVYEWSRMARGHGDTLAGSEVRVWDLRKDSLAGNCLADFLARRPGAAVGGTIPFRIESVGPGFRLLTRGSPRFNLIQADSAKR